MDVGTYLLNEKRAALREIELRYDVGVIMLPSPDRTVSSYSVERIRSNDRDHEAHYRTSFELEKEDNALPDFVVATDTRSDTEPVVKAPMPAAPPAAPRPRADDSGRASARSTGGRVPPPPSSPRTCVRVAGESEAAKPLRPQAPREGSGRRTRRGPRRPRGEGRQGAPLAATPGPIGAKKRRPARGERAKGPARARASPPEGLAPGSPALRSLLLPRLRRPPGRPPRTALLRRAGPGADGAAAEAANATTRARASTSSTGAPRGGPDAGRRCQPGRRRRFPLTGRFPGEDGAEERGAGTQLHR